jgi:LuxR family maltose regulon positive regulatory protein
VRGRRIDRLRLIERLDEAASHQFTVVTAPSGFGKSTLLAQWAEASNLPVSWLSLTATENDPRLMAAYLAAAIQAAGVPLPGLHDLNDGRHALDPDQLMTTLLGDLSSVANPVVLVLDDYQVIESDAAHDVVQALIDHAPDAVRMIISCRALPERVAACVDQYERIPRIGAKDLRFNLDETRSFLSLHGLDLQDEDVVALHGRVNGWVAGLQMFAITFSESELTVADALSGFGATNQLLHDFLLQEVLGAQPLDLQAFLLKSALLDRISVEMCREVVEVGQPSSGQLARAVQANLFLALVDSAGEWYEYEGFFHDFLRHRASVVLSRRMHTVLYRRASYWCEQAGFTHDAIDYAIAGEDWPHAVTMVVPAMTVMFGRDDISIALRWLQALPDHVYDVDAELAVVAGWAQIRAGALADVPRLLDAAQRLYEEAGDVLGLANVSCAIAELERYRADGPMCLEHARRTLELLARYERQASSYTAPSLHIPMIAPDLLVRNIDALTQIQIGTGLYRLGRVNEAADELQAAHAFAVAHNTPAYEATATVQLGQARALQGRLDDAIACYEAIATSSNSYIVSRRVALTGLAGIQRERHQFERAEQLLEMCQEIIDNSPIGFGLWNLLMSRARLAWARRSADEAIEYAEIAARRAASAGMPWHTSMAGTFAVRVRLSNGDIGPALEWAHAHRFAPDDQPGYERLHEYLVYARMLIAQGTPDEAIDLLLLSLDGAEADGRIGDVIEIGILQALAFQESGDLERATDALGRALRHGERYGYLDVFTDSGLPAMPLLQLAQASGITPSYCQRILDALGEPAQSLATAGPGVSGDAISQRELDVLRLIDRGLSNPEIASALQISGLSVKRHIESVHGKLGVWTHAEALYKARALGLLQASDDAAPIRDFGPGRNRDSDNQEPVSAK